MLMLQIDSVVRHLIAASTSKGVAVTKAFLLEKKNWPVVCAELQAKGFNCFLLFSCC